MTPITKAQKIILTIAIFFFMMVILTQTPLRYLFKPKYEVVQTTGEDERIKKLQTTIKEQQGLLLLNDSAIQVLEFKIDSLQELLTINNNTLQLIKKRRTNVQKFDYSTLTDSTINDFFAKRYNWWRHCLRGYSTTYCA